MKQKMLIQNGDSLLNNAISKLDPDVFSHPVWVRFGKKAACDSPGIIDDLLCTARNLENGDPSTACQLLLICAVYQSYGGQHYKALRTIQQALALAERASLFKEALCAIWGACAISIQQGNYQQATNSLVDLQALLSQHNEWILADFVDVTRGALSRPGMPGAGKRSGTSPEPAFGDQLTFILDWLEQWGFSAELSESESEVIGTERPGDAVDPSTPAQPFFSFQRLQGSWRSVMLAFRGEFRLQWVDEDMPHTKRQSSFWGSILNALRIHLRGRRPDSPVIDHISQTPGIPVLPSPTESSSPKAKSQKKKPVSTIKKAKRNQQDRQATTGMPVVVHLLGAFRMSIGDLTLKLPGSRGLSLLKFLLLHHKRHVPREVLMDIFWPDADPETARNSLNVAVHNLRQHLRSFADIPLIVFESGSYGLPPNLQVWIDVEEFERAYKTGQRLEVRNQTTAAIAEYECAVSLYQGDFLEENPYEEWTVLDRERFRTAYLETLDRLSQIYFNQEHYSACRTACQLILASDRCREDAHCLLMRCYSRQRQPHLALYQYQICVEALRGELQVDPAPETTQLYNRIRRRESV